MLVVYVHMHRYTHHNVLSVHNYLLESERVCRCERERDGKRGRKGGERGGMRRKESESERVLLPFKIKLIIITVVTCWYSRMCWHVDCTIKWTFQTHRDYQMR